MQFLKVDASHYLRVDSASVVTWDVWNSGGGSTPYHFRIVAGTTTTVAQYATEAEAQTVLGRAAEAAGDVYDL